MKKTKEELIATVNGLEVSDDVKIGLLEDVTDSMTEAPDLSGYVSKEEYEALKQKYIERFTAPAEPPKKDPEPEEDEPEEIKIEDLFTEEE